MTKFIILFLFLLPLGRSLSAKTSPVILNDGKEHYEINLNFDFLEDKTGLLKIEDVTSQKWANQFKNNKREAPSFGFSNSAFWFRVEVKNSSKESSWFISQNLPMVEDISFHQKVEGQWKSIYTGIKSHFKTREIEDSSFSFSIRPKESSLYFFRVKSTTPMVSFSLSSPKVFAQTKSKERLISGLFFGLVITVLLYNLFIYIATKSVSYIYYVLYVTFFGMLLFIIQGLSQRFLFPSSTWMAREGILFFTGLGGAFLCFFTISYLNLKEQTPKIYRGMQIISAALILNTLISFTSFHAFNLQLSRFIVLLGGPFVFFCGIYRVKMKYRPANYYLLAFSFMIAGILIFTLQNMGFLPSNLFTHQAVFIGTALQLILLSMGLADRFNLVQEEALNGEKRIAELLEEVRTGLEKKVAEKTNNLNTLVENLDQGFFTINKLGIIQKGATKASLSLFGTDLDNKNFGDVLNLRPKENQNLEKWLQHVFKEIVPFKDLIALAPHTFNNPKGQVIHLDYKPIFKNDGKKLEQIICIANDITEQVKFEKKAILEKEKAQRLTSILDRSIEFVDLIKDANETLDHYSKNTSTSKPQDIFRSFHNLKAQVASFKINDVVYKIHDLEDNLNQMNDDWDIQKVDLIHRKIESIKFSWKQFLKDNRRLIELANNSFKKSDDEGNAKSLISKIQSALEDFNKEFILKEVSTLFNQFISPTKELALQQDKLIDIKVQESDIYISPKKYKDFFSSLLHIFRNAIDHGTESREERVSKNKSETAHLKINFKRESKKSFSIQIKDDGKGIDPTTIRNLALKNKNFDSMNLDKVQDDQIIYLIFEAGFSSKEEATTVSGRGIGMDSVKVEVEKLGGEVKVASKIDEGTTFTIKLPILT